MKSKTKSIVFAAIVCAMYTALTMVSASFGLANGFVQVRISEALTILPFFTPHAIWGLFAGCVISNLLTACPVWDIVFGSLATLIGAYLTYLSGKSKGKYSYLFAPVGPIVSNTAIIPLILTFVYGIQQAYPLMCLSIFLGEFVSAGVLGTFLLLSLKKHQKNIF